MYIVETDHGNCLAYNFLTYMSTSKEIAKATYWSSLNHATPKSNGTAILSSDRETLFFQLLKSYITTTSERCTTCDVTLHCVTLRCVQEFNSWHRRRLDIGMDLEVQETSPPPASGTNFCWLVWSRVILSMRRCRRFREMFWLFYDN